MTNYTNSDISSKTVTLAKMSGTRMMPVSSLPGCWAANDWSYAEMCASVLDMYEAYEMSGSRESVSLYTYIGMLSDLVRDGAKNGDSWLQRAHCTAMSVMFDDMRGRIDRECAELSALLDSTVWDES